MTITLTSAVSATDGQSLSSGAIGGLVGGVIGGLIVITAIIGCIYLKSKERRSSQSFAHGDAVGYFDPSPKEQMSSSNLNTTKARPSGRVQYDP
jgi:hypothetical protein